MHIIALTFPIVKVGINFFEKIFVTSNSLQNHCLQAVLFVYMTFSTDAGFLESCRTT